MKLIKFFIVLVVISFGGCKEIYFPETDAKEAVIVIEGILTSMPGEASVTISKTVPFDSASKFLPVNNAKVNLFDNQGRIAVFEQYSPGKYINRTVHAKAGVSYRLHVETASGEVFESELQSLPIDFRQDTIYASFATRYVYTPDQFKKNGFVKKERNGIEINVDLSSGSNILPACRYVTYATALYQYAIPGFPPVMFVSPGTPDTMVYCWRTAVPDKIYVTENDFEKTVGNISKQPVCFFQHELKYLDQRENLSFQAWIIQVNKYNLTPEAHLYYKSIKNLLAANGRLFDPLPVQIHGNIKCISKPDKPVFGFFEVTQLQRSYYRVVWQNGVFLHKKSEMPGFSYEGETRDKPAFWIY